MAQQEINWKKKKKNLLAMQEMWVRSLGWEDPLEKGMATHFSILAWKSPWTKGPGYSPWGRKEWDTTEHMQAGRQDIKGKKFNFLCKQPQHKAWRSDQSSHLLYLLDKGMINLCRIDKTKRFGLGAVNKWELTTNSLHSLELPVSGDKDTFHSL